MKELVLLYNIDSIDLGKRIPLSCVQCGIQMKKVSPEEYKVPMGFLALGSKEDQEAYHVKKEEMVSFPEPMMVLVGFTGPRMNQFLNQMRTNKAPYIGLKAALTETNAEWDSIQLHDEIAKEHQAMKKR